MPSKSTIQKVAKAVVAACGAVVLVANGLADDGAFSTDELVSIVVAIGATFGVYQIPNKRTP